MSNNAKSTRHDDATYGRALIRNRGGWTLREILGAEYAKIAPANNCFSQPRSRELLEKTSRQTDTCSRVLNRK